MTMKKIIIYTISALIGALSFISCDDYLDKRPSKSSSTPLETVDQMYGLLDNVRAKHMMEPNEGNYFRSDDFELTRDIYSNGLGAFEREFIVWKYTSFVEGIETLPFDDLWARLYSSIYDANLIIEEVNNVTGSKEDKEIVLANAYFLRAYSYWVLVNNYCLPYSEANRSSLGVPKKLTTDQEEPYSRVPLHEIYELIESDLAEADKIPFDTVDPTKPWRISKTTVDAFRSRFYLHMNDYEKALIYSIKTLENAPQLIDYNKFGTIPFSPTVEFCETVFWTSTQVLEWQEWIYPRCIEDEVGKQIPSQELVNTYDQENDLRYKLFYTEDGNDFAYLSEVPVPLHVHFDEGYLLMTGLTTAEVYLNKAEAQIRTGKWQDGLKTLDILRQSRYEAGTYNLLSATSQDEALKIVVDERRREMPFSMRMYDVRRYSVNETPLDDVTIVRDFYEISMNGADTSKPATTVIPVGSPRYAYPLNLIEIDDSEGRLVQNNYSTN